MHVVKRANCVARNVHSRWRALRRLANNSLSKQRKQCHSRKGSPGTPPEGNQAPAHGRLFLVASLEELDYYPLAELVALAKTESQTDDVRLRVAQTVMSTKWGGGALLPPTRLRQLAGLSPISLSCLCQ